MGLCRAEAVGLGSREAGVFAELYRRLRRPRERGIDVAMAACALTRDAMRWSLNPGDFRDVPGLRLV